MQLPPGFCAGAVQSVANMNNYGGLMVSTNPRGVANFTRFCQAPKVMPDSGLYLQVYGSAADPSDELILTSMPRAEQGNLDFYAAAVGGEAVTTGSGGVASFGANVAVASGHATVVQGTYGPFTKGAAAMPQVRINAASTGQTDILGVRWVNPSPVGITIDALARSGYLSTSWISNHGNSWEIFAAMGYSAVVIEIGINDVYGGTTAANVAANVQTLMSAILANAPTVKLFILVAQPYRAEGNDEANYATYLAQHNLLAEQLALLATTRSDTIALNVHRAAYLRGDNSDTENYYKTGSYTEKGLYEIGAAYTVGDSFVSKDGNRYLVTVDNASASDAEDPGYNWMVAGAGAGYANWCRPIRQYLADQVHPSPLGAWLRADCFANLLLQAENSSVQTIGMNCIPLL
jgi:lysophospholipase L1-like esterase